MNLITREILESYFQCKHKAYLCFKSLSSSESGYGEHKPPSVAHFRSNATKKLLAGCDAKNIVHDAPLIRDTLGLGAGYLLNVTARHDTLNLVFDALAKAYGPSKLGQFHYVPVLYTAVDRVTIQERRLLAVFGRVLGKVQGHCPLEGRIVYGPQPKIVRAKIDTNDRKVRSILHDISDICDQTSPPPLILNQHCRTCQFESICRQQAADEDNLSLLSGMTEKQIESYRRRGIFTVSQLSYTYHASRRAFQGKKPHHDFALQALALREKGVFVKEFPEIPRSPVRVFLDVEGLPEMPFDYLIGARIYTAESANHYSFWADDQSAEVANLECFLDLLKNFGEFHVFHYGAYETNFLKRMRAKVQFEAIDEILQNATNILSLVYGRVYFPVHSNSLKNVARSLGFEWTDSAASGINSIAWRRQWEESIDPGAKERLVTYNRDDCTALQVVYDFIIAASSENSDMPAGQPSVTRVSQLPPTFSWPTWRTPQFMVEGLDYVNRCSYFDYQREKVYVRSNRTLARRHRQTTQPAKRIKATKVLPVLESSVCPYCGEREITKRGKHLRHRQCLDLRITKSGVRRVVKELVSPKYRCERCGKEFFAAEYAKLPKYGHSLKSFVVYEYVVHLVSLKALDRTIRDLFGLPVDWRHIPIIRHIMADYYKKTVEGIRTRLVSGPIIHADETQIHLKHGKGYVWVFTNMEEVLYIFKESRTGDFLREAFGGFSGVLISDFYAAYDWPGCAHQKCLIHLIRDMNNDLLRNPYDEEFRKLVTDFGFLLRSIVSTIDRYGLKRHHLGKHQREADRFLKNVGNSNYRSAVARSVQERILRYGHELFTFLKYDGVPWNNNNAEHAIKQFAHFRVVANGHLAKQGLADHLALLSIYQTCKYRGLNFLKFLLSGETDLDHYREPRKKLPGPAIADATAMDLLFFNKRFRGYA